MNELAEKISLRDRFRDVLIDAAKQRDQRREIVTTVWGPEIGWTLYERVRMQEAVNFALTERGLPPVGIDVIRRADQSATGHVDWLDKFALYCAEICLSNRL